MGGRFAAAGVKRARWSGGGGGSAPLSGGKGGARKAAPHHPPPSESPDFLAACRVGHLTPRTGSATKRMTVWAPFVPAPRPFRPKTALFRAARPRAAPLFIFSAPLCPRSADLFTFKGRVPNSWSCGICVLVIVAEQAVLRRRALRRCGGDGLCGGHRTHLNLR